MGGSNSKKEEKDKKAKPGFMEWKKENAGGPGEAARDGLQKTRKGRGQAGEAEGYGADREGQGREEEQVGDQGRGERGGGLVGRRAGRQEETEGGGLRLRREARADPDEN